jgi:hypothetical protein
VDINIAINLHNYINNNQILRGLTMTIKEWKKSQFYMTDKEICHYYCQMWENIKHMKGYIKALRNRYIREVIS